MKRLKVFPVACALLLTVSCGGGGDGGKDIIPDNYQGLYALWLIDGIDYSDYQATLSVTSSTIVEAWPGICRTQYEVTKVDGNRIYDKVASTTCSNAKVGAEYWFEFTLQGTTATVNTSRGSTMILFKIG